MPSLKIALTICAFFCLSFEGLAQDSTENKPGIFYALLVKGMPAPYDTTVAIHVTEYRKVRDKILIADELVAGKNRELAQAYQIIQEKDSAQNLTLEIASANARANERLTATNAQLNKDYDDLYLEATRPKKLVEKPGFWFTLGAVAGVLLKSL